MLYTVKSTLDTMIKKKSGRTLWTPTSFSYITLKAKNDTMIKEKVLFFDPESILTSFNQFSKIRYIFIDYMIPVN